MRINEKLAKSARLPAQLTRKFLQQHAVDPRKKFDGLVASLSHDLVRDGVNASDQRFFMLQMIRARHRVIIGAKSALGLLPSDQLIALCLVDGAKCGYVEAGRVSACTDEAVRSRLRRARESAKKNKKK